MIRVPSPNPLARLSSWLVILVLLLGGSYQLPVSGRDKGHKFVEVADQAISFTNPLKVKPAAARELDDATFTCYPNEALSSCSIEKDFRFGGSERNSFYVFITTNAP